jgi:glycosyltransferase involved in cell wall biosynthesis
MADKGISVVIPCLNEETSVGRVVAMAFQGLAAAGEQGEVIVVDNGSTDRSASVAAEAGARVISEAERGYGAAIRRGFHEARYDILVMADADLTYDLTELRRLTEPIRGGEADFVVGNRMRNIRPGAMPWLHRYVGNPLLSLMLRLMFHHHAVRDAHCGMRAISAEAYQRLRCVTTGMEFASEMIIQAIRNNLRIAERDIIYHPRVGESKLKSFRDGWRHLRFMMLHSPTSMLLVPGALIWLVGLLILVPLAFGEIRLSRRVVDIHTMIMGGFLNVAAVQLLTIGLLAKAYAHLSGLRNDPVVAWFYRHFTFEKAILIVAPVVAVGFGIILKVFWVWAQSGFGALNEARLLFLGLVLGLNGIQMATTAYLLSIMALHRHVDSMPLQAVRTGIPKL